MAKFILRRFLVTVITLFLISLLCFSLLHLLPGNPARVVLGEEAKQEQVDQLYSEMNLDKPIIIQYLLWISGCFKGDFGNSAIYRQPVSDMIMTRIVKTLSIGIPSLIISSILGICLGVISAVRRGKPVDQVITLLSTVGVGTPVFWIGILLIYIFGVRFGILPVGGYVKASDNFGAYIQHLILPVICMSLAMTANVIRHTRTNMLEVINQDYIRTARANGISSFSILFRHSLRNALIPVIAVIGLFVRTTIGGAVMVEKVSNISGIGSLMAEAVANRDYIVVQNSVFIIAVVVLACNFLVDLLYGLIDPRIRKGKR
ncbi:MAG: ABC transporter permease [Spirochaetales bacterium]|nr:ABC transporter permease [Spirochaetales bacterium]